MIISLLLIFIFGTVEILVSLKSLISYVYEASQKLNYSLAQNIADECKPFLLDSIENNGIKENDLSKSDKKNYLETILKNITNLDKLGHELYELSKLDAMESEPFSITKLTQDVVLKIQKQVEQKRVNLIKRYRWVCPSFMLISK